MMKFTLLPVLLTVAAGLSPIAWTIPAWAEPVSGEAADLLIPAEEPAVPFTYDTVELEQLSTQINHSVDEEGENAVQSVQSNRPVQDSDSPSAGVIFNNGTVAGEQEAPLR